MANLKNFLKTNTVTKPLFALCSKSYYTLITKREAMQKRHFLQKEGLPIIRNVQQILTDTGYVFFFDMGTLLGIVREGRLLKHDIDIDLAVVVSCEEDKLKIKELFHANGIEEKYRYTVDGIGIVEQSFYCRKVKFDINYYYTEEDKDVCYLIYNDPQKKYPDEHLDVVKLVCPHIAETQKILFQGIEINAPKNPEQYLATRYGENWRIPDKKYIYWKGPSAVATDYVGIKIFFE
jgi:phosphorylcholine metabolism protein LicD